MRALILASIFSLAALVASECCHTTDETGTYCADGFWPGAYQCCGIGACNIFCCDCDNGCRQPKKAARDIVNWKALASLSESAGDPTCGLFETPNQCALDKFEAIDANYDGTLSLDEVLAAVQVLRPYLNATTIDGPTFKQDITALFNIYDTNHDGSITLAEALTPQVVNID